MWFESFVLEMLKLYLLLLYQTNNKRIGYTLVLKKVTNCHVQLRPPDKGQTVMNSSVQLLQLMGFNLLISKN